MGQLMSKDESDSPRSSKIVLPEARSNKPTRPSHVGGFTILIYEVRGQKVMLDFDLARIYGYSTKAFNQQVKNNTDKFELDFMFCLTSQEWDDILKSKKLTANSFILNEGRPESGLRSKKSTANANPKCRYLPFCFRRTGNLHAHDCVAWRSCRQAKQDRPSWRF